MNAPIEVRRLSAGDIMRMQTIVAMLPQPEWRGAEIPSLSDLARALADPDIYVFAAFEGKRPMGFVSAYRFPSLAKQCDLVYIYDVYVAAADQDRGVGRRLRSPNAARTALPRRGSERIWTTKRRSGSMCRQVRANRARNISNLSSTSPPQAIRAK